MKDQLRVISKGMLRKYSNYEILIDSQDAKGIKCIPYTVAKEEQVLRVELTHFY